MKKLIDRFLDWLKIKPKPTLAEKLAACPSPLEEFPKAKPAVKKATTRKPAVKKPAVKKATTVAKKTTKKAK